MYNHDNEVLKDFDPNKKINIPTDIPNVQIAGDISDRAKPVKLKLNYERVKQIDKYLRENNEFYRLYTKWNEENSESIKKENEFYFVCKFQEFNFEIDK